MQTNTALKPPNTPNVRPHHLAGPALVDDNAFPAPTRIGSTGGDMAGRRDWHARLWCGVTVCFIAALCVYDWGFLHMFSFATDWEDVCRAAGQPSDGNYYPPSLLPLSSSATRTQTGCPAT
ncbi:hypothetical protein GCM10009682_05060 [Luedemannella flava]|uniref:Uncharacterized protein n=1 Tax=Luedemannella flava TaxID=349316 RepID=A0ABN2LEI1_9ACTN